MTRDLRGKRISGGCVFVDKKDLTDIQRVSQCGELDSPLHTAAEDRRRA
jgi:hypothetical protein